MHFVRFNVLKLMFKIHFTTYKKYIQNSPNTTSTKYANHSCNKN